MKIAGTENWRKIQDAYGFMVVEAARLEKLRQQPIETCIEGYFGNTLVFHGQGETVTAMLCYREDHTMSMWYRGCWTNGRWVVNNGQDSSKVFHSFEIDGATVSWRHAFAPFKQVGDLWVQDETETGIPVGPAVPVERRGDRVVAAFADIPVEAYFSLEKGILDAPAYDGEPYDFCKANWDKGGKNADKALEGYFGNTFYFRNEFGEIVECIYFGPDHKHKAWRNGWVYGDGYMLNNGQDSSCLIQSRSDLFDKPAGWCHPFAAYKQPGDMWVAPETHLNGDTVYPLTQGMIPVITVDGVRVVAGTSMRPREVYRIERGIVPLEELMAMDL